MATATAAMSSAVMLDHRDLLARIDRITDRTRTNIRMIPPAWTGVGDFPRRCIR
jgi:hypothetical protein